MNKNTFLSLSTERNSDCRNELHILHSKLKSQYVLLNANSDSNAAMKRASMIPPGHSIKGTLIAHLHEHKSSVTKLTELSSSSSLFASASTDGTVRLFDCNKLNGHQSINKYVSIIKEYIFYLANGSLSVTSNINENNELFRWNSDFFLTPKHV